MDSAQTPEEYITKMCEIIDKLTASLATGQVNQGQLTVTVNRMQSDKVLSTGTTEVQSSGDTIAHVVRHSHKLLIPTYDGCEDPLPWLNKCNQFFHIQSTAEVGKVFLTTFYMTSDASQWYTLLEQK
jgi:hypothetical protein